MFFAVNRLSLHKQHINVIQALTCITHENKNIEQQLLGYNFMG